MPASLSVLNARAQLYSNIRQFFSERNVLEVDVPLLNEGATTDPYLASCATTVCGTTHYLQTSPEFFLKRLLAREPIAVYSVSKAFRNEESGPRHRPEFTMLEWYRPGFSFQGLIDEVVTLVKAQLPSIKVEQKTYREVFTHHCNGIDPHEVTDKDLLHYTRAAIDLGNSALSRNNCLDLLMSHRVEPLLPPAIVLTDYPASQAALARLDKNAQGQIISKRFELYINQIEIANGYWELTDACEQRKRFENDNRERVVQGLPVMPVDEILLAALEQGLPDTCGVALGVDRLLMQITGAKTIDEVMTF